MSGKPLIIGHRGASSHAPENTLAAFKMAIDAGADGIEFDVQLASDGVPIVIHDATLSRTCLQPEAIAEMTSDQLGRTDAGSWFNAKYPRLANPEFSREAVPTLRQVLDLCRNFSGLIYIELKVNVPDHVSLAAAVCDTIRDSPQLGQMIVKSFKLGAIPEVRHRLPEVQTAALFEPSIMTILRKRKYIIAMAREFGADQISLHTSLATQKLASLADDAGLPVTIWTADNPRWIARCRDRNIYSLITNDPAELLKERAK